MSAFAAPWLWYTLAALVCFGVVGFFQKLSTDLLSAESALFWLVAGFLLLDPFIQEGAATFHYPGRAIALVLLAGLLNALGSWAILAAMKAGGKASVVVPMTAVYPMLVCLTAPLLFGEHFTWQQGVGVVAGLGAIVLLAE